MVLGAVMADAAMLDAALEMDAWGREQDADGRRAWIWGVCMVYLLRNPKMKCEISEISEISNCNPPPLRISGFHPLKPPGP